MIVFTYGEAISVFVSQEHVQMALVHFHASWLWETFFGSWEQWYKPKYIVTPYSAFCPKELKDRSLWLKAYGEQQNTRNTNSGTCLVSLIGLGQVQRQIGLQAYISTYDLRQIAICLQLSKSHQKIRWIKNRRWGKTRSLTRLIKGLS